MNGHNSGSGTARTRRAIILKVISLTIIMSAINAAIDCRSDNGQLNNSAVTSRAETGIDYLENEERAALIKQHLLPKRIRGAQIITLYERETLKLNDNNKYSENNHYLFKILSKKGLKRFKTLILPDFCRLEINKILVISPNGEEIEQDKITNNIVSLTSLEIGALVELEYTAYFDKIGDIRNNVFNHTFYFNSYDGPILKKEIYLIASRDRDFVVQNKDDNVVYTKETFPLYDVHKWTATDQKQVKRKFYSSNSKSLLSNLDIHE